jgi:hypothetical protein
MSKEKLYATAIGIVGGILYGIGWYIGGGNGIQASEISLIVALLLRIDYMVFQFDPKVETNKK